MAMDICTRGLVLCAAAASLLLTGHRLLAVEAGPATTQPAGTVLSGTITGIEGIVQVRNSENDKWQPAKVGMTVSEGAEFRTGPRSAVRFVIPPDQTVTLDRLGTVKLIEAIQRNEKVKTDLGMKYGRVRYDIEAAGQDHDSTIHSPGSALAVRGTRVSLYDQPPFKPEAVSFTGRALFRNARKQMVAVGSKGGRKAKVGSENTSSAQTASVQSSITSAPLQRTEQELRELNYLLARQGEVFGNVAFSRTPVTDAELPSLISGNLDFVLRWSSPSHVAADLNIVVNTPLKETFGNPPFILSLFPDDPSIGEFLKRNFPQSSPSGGSVGLNHIGPEGIEIASFGKNYPKGVYVVGAYNFIFDETMPPVGEKVPFKIEAFLNGKRQPVLLNLEQALAGEEPPRFGLVFKDSIAIGELAATAVQIGTAPATASKRAGAKPAANRAASVAPARKPATPSHTQPRTAAMQKLAR